QDELDVAGALARSAQHCLQSLEHGFLGRARRGEDLDRPLPSRLFGDDVGEGAADVDRNAAQRRSSDLFSRSVTTIAPGLWVMASGRRALASAFSGVTPQAQNTGSSSGATAIGCPPARRARSTPICSGKPICTGAPCTVG